MKSKILGVKKTSPELSIVIPVYNEPDNIILTLKSIKKNIKTKHEIIVVYDSNKDKTIPVLKLLQKKSKNLFRFKNSIASGPSGAIRTGILNSRGQLILVTMADLCDDLAQVESFIKKLGKKEGIVCPSRYTKGGKQELDAPIKVWFPKTAGYLLKLFTGVKTNDPTNSYKLYSKKMLEKMNLKSTISFSVTLEILTKAHLLNADIIEIPTVWTDRQFGKTNFKLGNSIVSYTPWFILALFRNRLFDLSLIPQLLGLI